MSSNSEKYLLFFAIFVIRKGYPAQRPLSIKSITCGRAEKADFFVLSDKRGILHRQNAPFASCHIPISSAIFSLTVSAAAITGFSDKCV